MKVTQVSIRATGGSEDAGRPALTPELLAATGARYSRNNEGLDAILARVNEAPNPDAAVDRLFKFVDYGHASIADMAPVALFIDGVSLFLAYYLWTLAPVAGGQESSTRYIRLDADGLVTPDVLGIPESWRHEFDRTMAQAFETYKTATSYWQRLVTANPGLARIPQSLTDDPSDKAQKAVARMRRNYAFDRARYFLPVAASTNVMMVQSARAWVTLCQHLLSHPLLEARTAGELIRDELALATPRLLKHATSRPTFERGIRREFEQWQCLAKQTPLADTDAAPTAFLETLLTSGATGQTFAEDLALHDNRYAYFGETLRRTAVRFGWQAVALAEIRDLNRHRTGTKYCPLVPVGFYHATDELPEPDSEYTALGTFGQQATREAHERLLASDPTFVYNTLLGTQFPFEHTTTADKFLYEAELRTGTGAHYRYAQHLRDTLILWYERFPETRGLVLEGSAEPE